MKISTSPAIFFLIDSFYKGYFFSALLDGSAFSV